MDEKTNPKLKVVSEEIDNAAMSVPKPGKFSLNKFKSKSEPTVANVETLLTGLPHHSIAQAKDFVRLHPNEQEHWSEELCFVNVPIKGQKHDTLHLIDEVLAERYLPSARILRFRLALSTKPGDIFFLCHVPSRNIDTSWNETNMQPCEQAKTLWTEATSLKEAGFEKYKVDKSRDPDAFPQPNWPKQSLEELIGTTFEGCQIEPEDHPGLLRLIGKKPSVS